MSFNGARGGKKGIRGMTWQDRTSEKRITYPTKPAETGKKRHTRGSHIRLSN